MLLDLERERPWMVEWGGRMRGEQQLVCPDILMESDMDTVVEHW